MARLGATVAGGEQPMPGTGVGNGYTLLRPGVVAQLGERLHGMQEVRGSIPLDSTMKRHFEFVSSP